MCCMTRTHLPRQSKTLNEGDPPEDRNLPVGFQPLWRDDEVLEPIHSGDYQVQVVGEPKVSPHRAIDARRLLRRDVVVVAPLVYCRLVNASARTSGAVLLSTTRLGNI